MSPARALALAAVDHGRVVRHHACDPANDHGEIAAAWELLHTSARLFADEHQLDEPQMFAVLDVVVNAAAIATTTERNQP